VAQQPPEAGGASLAGFVVGDHPAGARDSGAAGGGLEVGRFRQWMAPACTWLGGEVAVDVEKRGAGDVPVEPERPPGARLPEHVAAVDDDDFRVVQVGPKPGRFHERSKGSNHGEKATPGPGIRIADECGPSYTPIRCISRPTLAQGPRFLARRTLDSVRAMVLDAPRSALRPGDLADPEPGPGDVLLEVAACGICRTDLHVVDGELQHPKLPLVPGHQIVGRLVQDGERFAAGDRVGVPWLGWTCGECRYCRSGRENLCDRARFTGYDRDGGFARFAVADERFCFALPDGYPDLQAAPLLCAGLIGYRTLRMAGDAERVGIYGFGAAAHIVCQVARHQGRRVFAFTRAGDADSQAFALELGAEWAGDALGPPPEELDAALIFAPVGELVPAALKAVAKGGSVVCGGIHMSDIPSMPYELLWGERVVRSVANLTRADGEEFLELAPRVPVRTQVETHPLDQANEALERLRGGRIRGAAVLVP
jgi:alcohol dehydrogenase, propanol-preferring